MAHASVPHVMGMYGCAACNAAVLRCRLAPCSVRVVRSVMIRAPRLRQQRAGEPNYPSRGSGHRRAGHNSSVLLGLVCLGLRCADMLGELLCDMRHSTLALQERMEQENKNAYEAFHGLMRGPVDEGAHSTAAVRADAWLDVSEATVPLPALLQLVGPSSAVTGTSTSLHDIVHGGGEFEACDCCDPPTWLRRRQGGSARALHAMAVARRRAAEEALDAAHQAELVAEHTDEEGMFEGLETTDSMQRALDKCDQCHLDVCTDMRVNHYLPQSSVQCHKEGIARLASAQSAAIKEALRGKLKEGVDLDELIDPIMKAHEKFRDKRAEARARDSSYHYQVTPRKRLLPPTAGGNPVTVWDVPLEESLQRELYYNPSFSEYFVDWGDCPASPPGVYRSARNGSAAHNHPTLGNTDWDGPPRLAFGAYTDDVEVCNPIGSARCKHKVALHYAVLLNAPPHISSKLDLIFLVSVTLRKSHDAAGVAEVVSGDGSCEPAMPGGIPAMPGGLTLLRPILSKAGLASKEWQAWVAHTEYFVAMMKSEFTDASIALLDEMIQKAQTLFIQLYPHLWKPKNHFAQHIPADIKRFGPPRTYWCMRFEAKNQEHKRAAKTGNWRDTPGTIAHFWVDRSAFRLRTEAQRPVEPTTPVGEPVGTTSLADGTSRINLGALLHHGVNLGVGDWLLVTPPDGAGPPVLANVFSLYAIEDSNGEVTGYWMDANTWWPAAVLRRDNHGMIVADGSTFTSGYEVASFSLSSAALTPLYVVDLEQDDGVLAFLERT